MSDTMKHHSLDSAMIDPFYIKNGSSRLTRYHFSEVPHYLQGNPFIQRGYLAQLSYKKCMRSTFVWSNETVNVWSHLIGFMIFLALTIYDNLVTIPRFNGTLSDHLIYTLFLSCFQLHEVGPLVKPLIIIPIFALQFCMLCSAGFHLFRIHSEEVSKRWFALDLAGVSIGMLGCYFPSIYYGFFCFQYWKNVHMVVVCFLLILTLIIQLHRRFLTSSWATRRLLLFSATVAYGVGPSIHWIYLHGGFQAEIVQIFLPKLVVMYALAILALFFYATKFPERCFPGKVDYIGSSHQWWHLIIVAVFLWWHDCGVDLVNYRTQYPCAGGDSHLNIPS